MKRLQSMKLKQIKSMNKRYEPIKNQSEIFVTEIEIKKLAEIASCSLYFSLI